MRPSSNIRVKVVAGSRIFVLLAVIALLLTQAAKPQKIFDPPRVVLDYRCPTYVLPGHVPIILRAEVIGAKTLLNEQQAKLILFKWWLSEGKLLNGQGTEKVVIDTSGLAGNVACIDLKLEVEGAPPEMEREKACTIRIDRKCNSPTLLDEYSGVGDKEERGHLDHLAKSVKDAGPQAITYVISYAGRRSCIYEADWRAARAKKYLVEEHKLESDRIITVDGGVRENWSIELFIQAVGTCGPQPNPTLMRGDAQVIGQCSGNTETNEIQR